MCYLVIYRVYPSYIGTILYIVLFFLSCERIPEIYNIFCFGIEPLKNVFRFLKLL